MEKTINLSNFVNKDVVVKVRSGRELRGRIVDQTPSYTYVGPYRFRFESYDGSLVSINYCHNGSFSALNKNPMDIMEIRVSAPILGQVYPNIDLYKFIGQEVYVKVNKEQTGGASYSPTQLIGRVIESQTPAEFLIQGNFYNQDGSRCPEGFGHITEIYPTGAWEVVTTGLEASPKAPPKVDEALEKVRQALGELNVSQVETLLEELTKRK